VNTTLNEKHWFVVTGTAISDLKNQWSFTEEIDKICLKRIATKRFHTKTIKGGLGLFCEP